VKESFWGIMILVFGVVAILLVYFFQSMTNTDEHNYTLLKEATEGAMIDAIDLAYYRQTGKVRIDQEKFVENFVRRFAQSAQLSRTYEIKIYDVSEEPPKVSLSVASKEGTNATGELVEFDIINRLDAILETPRDCSINSIVDPDPGYQIIMPTQTTSKCAIDISTATNPTQTCNIFGGSVKYSSSSTLCIVPSVNGTCSSGGKPWSD